MSLDTERSIEVFQDATPGSPDVSGRRYAVKSLGALGMATLAAFGLSASAPTARAKKKGKKGGGAGAGTPGPAGPQGPRGPQGPPGTASGASRAFQGVTTEISDEQQIPSTSSRIATARCTPVGGQTVVATGGGFDSASFDLKIQFSQPGDDGESWEVHAHNPTGSEVRFTASVVCVRFAG